MEMTLRALGWATKLLWIILIATVITIAYSATQINIAFGDPTTAISGEAVTISMPINIHNAGLFDLDSLNVTTQISDQNSNTLAKNTTFTQVIPEGTNVTAIHMITINITKILAQYSYLLFNDTSLITSQYVAFNYANAIPLTAHSNQTTQWGAPLSKLAINQVTFQPLNTTFSLANFQLYFENHNEYISINGTTRIEIYDSHQRLIGAGTTAIDAPPNSSFNGQIVVPIHTRNILSNPTSVRTGYVHLFFETPAFSYGPVVIPYG